MRVTATVLVCGLLLAVSACVTRWEFLTGNEQPGQGVQSDASSIAVSTAAKLEKDAENLRVAIEGELLALGTFRDVVRSCDKADYCLRARLLTPGENGYDDLAASFGGIKAPSVVGLTLNAADGRLALGFDLGGVAGGGPRPATGTVTIMGTEAARQLAKRVGAAE